MALKGVIAAAVLAAAAIGLALPTAHADAEQTVSTIQTIDLNAG